MRLYATGRVGEAGVTVASTPHEALPRRSKETRELRWRRPETRAPSGRRQAHTAMHSVPIHSAPAARSDTNALGLKLFCGTSVSCLPFPAPSLSRKRHAQSEIGNVMHAHAVPQNAVRHVPEARRCFVLGSRELFSHTGVFAYQSIWGPSMRYNEACGTRHAPLEVLNSIHSTRCRRLCIPS